MHLQNNPMKENCKRLVMIEYLIFGVHKKGMTAW